MPGVDEGERAGWYEIARPLDGRPRTGQEADWFCHNVETPQWAKVDLSGIRIERVRKFGKINIALALWRQLGLHEFFEADARSGREQVEWATVACILSLGRFCEQGSENGLESKIVRSNRFG
jgi:hypothetical protein